jgi:hypothetical protein
LDGCVNRKAGPENTYRARRRRRRILWLAAVGVAASVAVFAAWRPDLENPCDVPSAAAQAEMALLPAGLSLDGIATVTGVQKDEPYINAQAVGTMPLEELTVRIQHAATAAGYRPAGMDGEEFEAEVFFTLDSYAGGQARVQQAACQGRWDIDLVLLDPDALPSGTTGPPTVP